MFLDMFCLVNGSKYQIKAAYLCIHRYLSIERFIMLKYPLFGIDLQRKPCENWQYVCLIRKNSKIHEEIYWRPLYLYYQQSEGI